MFALPTKEDKEYIIEKLDGIKAMALHLFLTEADPFIQHLNNAMEEMKNTPAEEILH